MKRPPVWGFRPFWLALERTVVWVRDCRIGQVVLVLQLGEGDGLVLENQNHRADFKGALVPVGTEKALRARSDEIRTLRANLAAAAV